MREAWRDEEIEGEKRRASTRQRKRERDEREKHGEIERERG